MSIMAGKNTGKKQERKGAENSAAKVWWIIPT